MISGSNGYSARASYDLATGRGSPVANRVVNDLAGFANSNVPTTTGTTSGSTTTTGTSGGWSFWWFRWWFGPPFYTVTIVQMTAQAAPSDPGSAVQSQSAGAQSLAGQPLAVTLSQPSVGVVGSNDAVFARPASQPFGNGVARLDWSDDSEDDDADDVEF